MSEKFNIESQRNPSILLAPLDWGLGHTTRIIPIIRYLQSRGCEVIVAGEENQLALLKLEFPSLPSVYLRGYNLKFSNNRLKTIVKVGLQIPQILAAIWREHRWLRRFAQEKRIDAVISDNRYGFFLRSVPSVFITHQLIIKTPFGTGVESLLRRLNFRFISRFSECWVPDVQGSHSLAGELSGVMALPKFPVRYIGILSRFKSLALKPAFSAGTSSGYGLLLISGPEPQRSLFERAMIRQASAVRTSLKILRGLPGSEEAIPAVPGNVSIQNHANGEELQSLIEGADVIISRSGYTTVMEMFSLKKKCIFIPTPGQTEQEYLAKRLSEKGYAIAARQSDFRLDELLEQAKKMEFLKYEAAPGPDEEVMNAFLKKLRANLATPSDT